MSVRVALTSTHAGFATSYSPLAILSAADVTAAQVFDIAPPVSLDVGAALAKSRALSVQASARELAVPDT